MSIIREVDVDTYDSTVLSNALAEPKYKAGVVFW